MIILTHTRVIPLITFIILFSFILMPHRSFAEDSLKENLLKSNDSPAHISAKTLMVNKTEEGYIAEGEGDVLIYNNELSLSADNAEYNKKSGDVKATGDVRIESSEDILECEEGAFNLKDQTGKVLDGVLFLKENNFHILGGVIKKTANDTYSIEDFRLSTCDNEAPSWSITGSEINVVKEGYGKIKNAAFRIKDFPVFYLPYMIFPAMTKRQTGLLLPQFGYSRLNGAGMEIPFFWAISDKADATLYERYMDKRGLMQGLEFRYTDDHNSKGEFLFDFLRDKIGEKDLTDLSQAKISPFERTNQDRYWLRGRMDQELSDGLTARLDLDLVSDQDYLREFEGDLVGFESRPDLKEDFGRPLEERFSSFRRSALRISRDGEDYSLQGSGYYYQISDNQTDGEISQPLAGIFYSLLPTKLSQLPLFFNLTTDYNYIRQDTGVKGHSLSVNPEISYPKQLGDYLKLDSSLGYTGNLESYDAPSGNKDSMVKDAYQAKVALSTILERIFAFDWSDVTKLKHKVTPSLTYEYRTLPEDQDESPWFDPIDSGSKINRVGLSIENLLDASLKNEKGEVSYSQWAQFNITQTYDFNEADKEVWEPLLATLILKPFKDINLRANAAWDHYEDKISTAVLSLNLAPQRSGDTTDRYSIDYVKDADNNDSLNLRADVTIVNGFSAGVLLKRDLDLKYTINNSFWLKYQAQCWSIKFGMEKETANNSIILKFQLAGF